MGGEGEGKPGFLRKTYLAVTEKVAGLNELNNFCAYKKTNF